MNNENVQGTKLDEKPLFVLKYGTGRIAWRLFWPYLVILPVLSYAAFWKHHTGLVGLIGQIVVSIFVVGGIYLIYDMLAMEGIYLYADRVVKRYRSKKDKVVFLERAKYNATSTEFIGNMGIFDETTPLLLRGFKDVYFDEKLAAPKDVKKFREILAHISGKNIEDIKTTWSAKRLMERKEMRHE